MDEEILRDAAYRGTLQAVSLLCFSLIPVNLAFVMMGFTRSGILGPLVLAVLGVYLRAISRLPSVRDRPVHRPAKGLV